MVHAASIRLDAQGIDPKTYTHREYFIPTSVAGCNWGGLAYVGCATPGPRKPGACQAWIRDRYATTRAHEFGHNLGASHAGGAGVEYGDNSGVMGSARNWKAHSHLTLTQHRSLTRP